MIDANNLSQLAPAIAALETLLYSIEDRVQEAADSLVSGVEQSIAGHFATLTPAVAAALAAADVNLPGEPGDGPLDWAPVTHVLGMVGATIDRHEVAIDNAVVDAHAFVNNVAASIVPSLGEIMGSLTSLFGHLIDGLLGSLTDTDDLWTVLLSQIRDQLGHNAPNVGDWVYGVFDALIKSTNERMVDPSEFQDRFTGAAHPVHPFGGMTVEQYIEAIKEQPYFVRVIFNVLSVFVGAIGFLNARNAGVQAGMVQSSLYEALTAPLSVEALVALVKLEAVGKPFAVEMAKRSGLSPELFDLKLAEAESLLTPPQIMALWLRTGTDTVLGDLKRLGYSDVAIERMKALSLAMPTASDVVRFLARDVFDDAAIARGGLDQDYDQKYNEQFFRAAGVSKETGLLYWMAHWSLPSPSMGYQMLHRGIIDQPTLEELLKLADYAPGWVSQMVDIAYNVPGRIDVRRMFKVGTIADHAGLVSAYQRMGYSPDDSEILAGFTETENARAVQSDNERRVSHTAGEIVRSFVVGSLSEVQARDVLAGLGLAPERIDVLIGEGKLGRAREKATRIRDALRREYVRGFLTEGEARSRLAGYGFDQEESDFLLESWNLDLELQEETDARKHAKDLSRSEVIEAYRDRIADRQSTVSALVSLGFDETEAAALIAIEDAKEARQDAATITSSARAQYLARRIDASAARGILEGAGLQPSRIAALLSRWETELEEHRPTITNAQLQHMLSQGIIDQDTIEAELLKRGYSQHDVNMLLTMWGTDVSIAQDQLAEKVREFNVREARITQQGAQRIGLESRGLDIRETQFADTQSAVAARFRASQEQQSKLAQDRIDATSALQAQRLSAQTIRDAKAFEASRERQARQIAADQDRIQKQIDAANARADAALRARQEAEQTRRDLTAQAQAASDARQARTLQAQADRQQRMIEAANARANAAAAARQALQTQHEQATQGLVLVRDQLQQARDIRQNAERIEAGIRSDARRVQQEQRASARSDLRAANVAANASQIQSLQLQQTAAVASVNAQFAGLLAQAAAQRQQAAVDAQDAARRSLAAATPPSSLLDSTS